jgi:aarF domain-containing kinase
MVRLTTKDAKHILNGVLKITEAVAKEGGPEAVARTRKVFEHGFDFARNITGVFSSKLYRTAEAEVNAMKGDMARSDGDSEKERTETEKEKHKDMVGFPERTTESQSSSSSSVSVEMGKKKMRENAIPSTQFGRVVGFGSLAAQLAVGMAGESVYRFISGDTNKNNRSSGSQISDANAERLAEALCRMRGAALKLGQMLSIQDTDGYLPPALEKALVRVRESADYMPRHQLVKQLESELGSNWISHFESFDYVPLAAASIGQVHKAKLKDGSDVVVKVQYPGVYESIESDLNNLKLLVTNINILPKGLYIDEIMRVAGSELKEECDYNIEKENQKRFKYLVENDSILNKYTHVPDVIDNEGNGIPVSTKRILTSEYVAGVSLDQTLKSNLNQETRNAIARIVLILTMKELFEWRFMQTDPNFSNFLYDDEQQCLNLIDFGASRQYSKDFVDGYMKIVWAAANEDKDTLLEASKDLGFLTGDESSDMIEAHIDSGMVVGEPFRTPPGVAYDFSGSKLTQRIGKHGSTFMKDRLTPPPPEAYSLHRKLAGAFLLCIKLNASIHARDILDMVYEKYKFD